MNARFGPKRPRSSNVIDVRLCESCARAVWPSLKLPSYQESVLLTAIAEQLEKCPDCISQAGKVRHAAKQAPTHWAWVS